jgi:hypothetical protein
LQTLTALEDVFERDEVLAVLRKTYFAYKTANDLPMLFTVSPTKFDSTINYVPTRRVHCMAPSETGGPTS